MDFKLPAPLSNVRFPERNSISELHPQLISTAPASLGLQVVDVRDTADIHLLAMKQPAVTNGRDVAAGELLWFEQFARIVR